MTWVYFAGNGLIGSVVPGKKKFVAVIRVIAEEKRNVQERLKETVFSEEEKRACPFLSFFQLPLLPVLRFPRRYPLCLGPEWLNLCPEPARND